MKRRKKPPLPTIIVKAGTPAFEAWMRHFRATGRADAARFAERYGMAHVHTEFPRLGRTPPAPFTNRIVGEGE